MHLDEPGATSRFMEELAGKAAQPEKLHLAMHLRFLKTGWTTPQKLAYLEFCEQARSAKGGAGVSRYLEAARPGFRRHALAGRAAARAGRCRAVPDGGPAGAGAAAGRSGRRDAGAPEAAWTASWKRSTRTRPSNCGPGSSPSWPAAASRKRSSICVPSSSEPRSPGRAGHGLAQEPAARTGRC